MLRSLRFYIGVWIPLATCWCVVVIVSAVFKKPASLWTDPTLIWKVLGVALVAPFLALIYGARKASEGNSGSLDYLRAHPDLSDREVFRRGVAKGLWVGPFSVLCLGAIASLPYCLDRLFTALGK
jgi:hypothetical protein